MSPEITLPIAELKQALPGFSKLISKPRTLPVLQSVRVSRNNLGVVTLEGTDLDAHVAYQLKDAQAGKPVEVLVPFDALSKTAKGTADTLTLIPDGKNNVKLRYQIGNSPVEQRISTPETKEWPEAPKITSTAVPMDKEFGPTLKEALQCASDTSRSHLHGAFVDVSDKKAHYIIGTNGHMMYAANSFCFDLKQSVTIPSLKFIGWNGFLSEGECTLAVQTDPKQQSTWLQLQSGPWTLTARQAEGVYPNWRHALNKVATTKGTTLKLSPEAIEQMLKVLPQLPGEDGSNAGVRLRVGSDLFIEGRDKEDKDWTSIVIAPVTITGTPAQVSLSRHYLAQALRFGLDQIVIQDELTPLIFSQGGRKLVVMPLQPSPTAVQPAKVTPAPTNAPAKETEKPTPTTNQEKQMPKQTTDTPEPAQGLKAAIEKIESLRDTLKTVTRDCTDVIDALKAAEKEHRTSQKEFNSLRSKLREIQSVKI